MEINDAIPQVRERCPKTSALLDAEPSVMMAGFSIIGAGTQIYPHKGYTAEVLRLHLGLIVPESGCGLRVASETLRWEEGKCIIFDDTKEHEAWNESPTTRVVLLMDISRSSFSDN